MYNLILWLASTYKIITNVIYFILLVFLFSNVLSAQDLQKEGTNSSYNKYSIETHITYPANRIYTLQGTYSITPTADVLLGLAYQNQNCSEDGRSHAMTLLIGYRQYLWKGLHLEASFWPAYNSFHSFVDDKNYKSFESYCELRLGYRIDFPIGKNELSVLLQPSIGFGLFRTNPWPKHKDSTNNDIGFAPSVVLGYRF